MQFVNLPQRTWPFLKFNKNHVYGARFYKKEYGFNPCFISSVNSVIKPEEASLFIREQNFDVYFPRIPFPEVFVRHFDQYLCKKRLIMV